MLCRRWSLYRATSLGGDVYVFWEQWVFSSVEQKNQAPAHSSPLCWKGSSQCCCELTRSYFHSPTVSQNRVGGKKHAYRCPLTTPCTPIHVCVQGAIQANTPAHILRVLVLNNDMLLPRMSMSLPVFVRSHLVLLWKLNVILKNAPSVAHSLCVEKSQSIRQSQTSSPTLAAAARLSAMIHGKDQVYANAMLVDQVSRDYFLNVCSLSLKKGKKMKEKKKILFKEAEYFLLCERQAWLLLLKMFHKRATNHLVEKFLLIVFSLFHSRWMTPTLGIALKGKNRSAFHPTLVAPAGIRSLRLPLSQAMVPRAITQCHPTTDPAKAKALAWTITGSHHLASLPPHPSLPPLLFLPLPWHPPSVCVRECSDVRRRRALRSLLLWITENVASQMWAGGWGRTVLLCYFNSINRWRDLMPTFCSF